MYRHTQEALNGLKTEIKACKKYADLATQQAQKGNVSSAIQFLKIAQTARTCANQAHEALWDLSKGQLSDDAFDRFCEAETLSQVIHKAHKAIQQARA
ncbi:hypothetical protein KG089_00455 [Carnobacteriaceae bacterium zg-ZUI252]|nr:hypothetical protein [Carnobacteriaceae bacterium zg-ZUI252]